MIERCKIFEDEDDDEDEYDCMNRGYIDAHNHLQASELEAAKLSTIPEISRLCTPHLVRCGKPTYPI